MIHTVIPSAQEFIPLGQVGVPFQGKSNNPSRTPANALLYPKYFRDVSHMTHMDVYAVHSVFGINDPSGCIQHASKKLLLSGTRTGGKSAYDDIREARDTLNRYLELHPQPNVSNDQS